MYKKVPIKKGVNVVLVVSMIGMGSLVNIPDAYAAGGTNGNISVTQLEQTTSSNILSRLEIEGVQLDQPFESNVKEYSAAVENNVESVKLLAEPSDSSSTITVNDQPLTSEPYPVHIGENVFTITVDDGTNISNTYTLKVTRKQNSNNLLQNILLSQGKLSPAFDPSINSYHVQVSNEVAELTVTPQVIEKTSTILVNNTDVTDKGASVQIPVGKSAVTILVTAENGEKKTYTLEVTRDPKKTKTTPTKPHGTNGSSFTKGKTGSKNMNASGRQGFQLQNNANVTQNNANVIQKTSKATLSKLTVSKGTWNKSFASTQFTYHIAEDADVTEVTLSTNQSYSGATISIEGDTSNVIQLGNNKKTIIPVVVTIGDEHKTYVLVFDKNIEQKAVTTDDTVEKTDSATMTNSQDSTVSTPVKISSLNGRKGNTTTSWWGRLINKIRSFF
jgi:hypothetical protein